MIDQHSGRFGTAVPILATGNYRPVPTKGSHLLIELLNGYVHGTRNMSVAEVIRGAHIKNESAFG